MSVFSEDTIRFLDQLFTDAQTFFTEKDFINAYTKCDEIKQWVEDAQNNMIKSFSRITAGIGVVAGFVAPGVGNIVGGTVGGFIGHWVGKYLVQRAVTEGGTIEEIKELAIAGKQEAKAAQARTHASRHGKLPKDSEIYSPLESFYTRWERIRQEVLNA